MDLTSIPLFSALTRKMSWLSQRQTVLAQNVANVDTPGYRASDLRPLDFRSELAYAGGAGAGTATLTPTVTNPAHLKGFASVNGTQSSPDRAPEERELNGNTVSMEDQMMKVSETSADYQMMTNLYKKQINLISTAIGRGA